MVCPVKNTEILTKIEIYTNGVTMDIIPGKWHYTVLVCQQYVICKLPAGGSIVQELTQSSKQASPDAQMLLIVNRSINVSI